MQELTTSIRCWVMVSTAVELRLFLLMDSMEGWRLDMMPCLSSVWRKADTEAGLEIPVWESRGEGEKD